jgi:peptide/nickel transport system permease protein
LTAALDLSPTAEPPQDGAPASAPRERGVLRSLVRGVVGTTEGKIGLAIVGAYVFVIIFGPLLAPYSPDSIGVGGLDTGPSTAHLLGTDDLGRDLLSRLLYGARSVVLVPLIATFLAFAIGGLVGVVAGYTGGRFDAFASRVIDVMLALPPLLIVLVVIAAAGTSSLVIIVSVALVYSPRVARVLRGATQGVVTQEYILAAQARGEPTLAIVLRELTPNIAPTVFVEFAVRFTYVIIFITTLNFLGLGVAEPSPNWGLLLADARNTIITNPVASIAPAVAIGALAVGIGLIADAATQSFGLEGHGELLSK